MARHERKKKEEKRAHHRKKEKQEERNAYLDSVLAELELFERSQRLENGRGQVGDLVVVDRKEHQRFQRR